MLGYHGAGHLIEPPYIPHVTMSYQKIFDINFNWGGETKAHSVAQEHFWAKALAFFREHLPRKPPSKLLSGIQVSINPDDILHLHFQNPLW